jgi:hypothetical protein
MEATQILIEEHRVIERVLDALEVAAQKVEEDGRGGARVLPGSGSVYTRLC